MAAVILTHPAKAAEQVCHDDQLQVWAHELLTDLLMSSDALREDMSYDDQVVAERVIQAKIKSIVTGMRDNGLIFPCVGASNLIHKKQPHTDEAGKDA